MKRRVLGKTGLAVSELGMGGLFVSRYGTAFDEGREAILWAVDLGVNFIDTAPGYADSESVIGKVLPEIDAPLILSTKLGGRPQPFRPRDRDCLMASVEESLKLLGRDTIDLLMIHEPDRPGQYDWWPNLFSSDVDQRYAAPVIDLMQDLKRQGIIRYTGLGGTTAYEIVPIIKSGPFDVVLTAFNYSLLWREAEVAVLPAAKEMGMGIVIGSPLQQGALAQKYDEVRTGARWLSPPRQRQLQALYDFADEVDMALPELALRFVISNPDISCVLMGARSEREVALNVASVERGPLSQPILERLDEIAAMVPFRPFEEPFGLPFGRNYRGPGVA